MSETTFVKAINDTLARMMREDDRVIVLGEDVAEGGPYLATEGLAEEFGTTRVRGTPISEGAVCGVAIGAAQAGLRPVVEIMFIDFLTLALDQLVNQAAKAHFMSGGQLTVPLVLRTQGGSGQRSGAQHSQSLEAWVTHIPGLKVVMPSSAADAAGLLRSAIADPNPVVFVENKSLYFRRENVPDPPEPVEIGRAHTVRSGHDITIVATSRLLGDAVEVADRLASEGIEADVIDPRTLVPLDVETIAASVRRTGRAVVAHEAVTTGGFGAEIAAQVQDHAFDCLEAPIQRVGAPFTPVPVSPPLEDAYRPGVEEIYAAARVCIEWDQPAARAAVNMGPRYSSDGAVQYGLSQHPSKIVFVQSNVPGTGYIAAGPASLAKAANVPITELTENVPINDASSVALDLVNKAGSNGWVVLNFTPPEALVILQAAQKLGLEDRVKGWGCSTPCNTDFLSKALGPKWNHKLFVNAELTSADDHNGPEMQLYKAILAKYGQSVAGGVGSFSQMGYLLAKFSVNALQSVKPPYTIKNVNAAFKAIKDQKNEMQCQPWVYGDYPLHIPNNADFTTTPDNGKMVTAQQCFNVSSADPQIAQYRKVAGTAPSTNPPTS